MDIGNSVERGFTVELAPSATPHDGVTRVGGIEARAAERDQQ